MNHRNHGNISNGRDLEIHIRFPSLSSPFLHRGKSRDILQMLCVDYKAGIEFKFPHSDGNIASPVLFSATINIGNPSPMDVCEPPTSLITRQLLCESRIRVQKSLLSKAGQ